MDILFDTSVLIAGMVQAHPHFSAANPWLVKATKKSVNMIIAAHSIAECYSSLTKLPLTPRISPSFAYKMIQSNIIQYATVVHLTGTEINKTIRSLADEGFKGGITYDRLIFQAGVKANVNKILTLNRNDFERFCTENPKFIVVP